MHALDAHLRRGQLGGALLQELLAGEAARRGQPREGALVLDQEARRLADADLAGHRQQLGAVDRAGDAEQERHGDAALPHPPDPGGQHLRVEGQVADHVGGVAALVPHRLDGQVVVDGRVRLGVAGDADVWERAAQLLEVLEHAEGVGVGTGRVGVAAGHEDPGDALAGQPVADLGQLGLVAHHPGGEVGHGDVAVAGQPLGQVERRLQALARRGRDGDGAVDGHVLEELVLDRGRREHLVASVLEQADRRRRHCGLVAHDAPCSVMRTGRRTLSGRALPPSTSVVADDWETSSPMG